MGRRRGCLLFAAVAAAIVLVAGVAAYRALNPEALRQLAERRLTALVGQPVTIGRLEVRLFPPALETAEVTISASDPAGSPSMSVRGLRLIPAWRTLLSRPIVIETVEVRGLAVKIRRTREGRWVLPGTRSGGDATREPPAQGMPAEGMARLPGGLPSTTAVVRHVRLREGRLAIVDDPGPGADESLPVAAIDYIDADLRQDPDGAVVVSMRAALGRSALTGRLELGVEGLTASVQSPSLENADVPTLFALLGASAPPALSIGGPAPLDLAIRVRRDTGALSASGRLEAATVRFGTLELARVSAPFRLHDESIVVEPLAAAGYGGTQRGSLTVRLSQPAAWTLAARADGIDINQFLSANTTARDRLLGTGQLVARLRGTAESPVERRMNGTLDVRLTDGVIREFPLLATLNRALRVTGGEGNDTRFERLSAQLQVSQGALRTENATLAAGELTALAKGTLTFDRAIDMTGTAVFSREASARMIAAVKEISGAKNERGEVEVPFGIRGTVDQPAFSVDVERILRRALGKEIDRNIKKTLDRLLGRP